MDNGKLHVSIDDSYETSPSKQSSIEPAPNTTRYSFITQLKLKPLFDALNKNFFNGRFELSGDIKWSDYLMSRTAAVLHASTSTGDTKQFLRLSKPLMEKCTRKQLIESLMYEMIYAYVNKFFDNNNNNNSDADDGGSRNFELVLKEAMGYVNTSSGMQLSLNHSFSAHKTIEANSQWIDVDGALSVLQNNNIIVYVSDNESDDESGDSDESNQLVDLRRNNCTAVQFVSKKIHLSDWSNDLCMFQLFYIICFRGTNFKIIPDEEVPAKCPLCCQMVERKTLNVHFNDCDLFCS